MKLMIELAGNENVDRRAKNVIYAELYDDEGIVLSTPLDYALVAIRDRGYDVEGVRVTNDESGSHVRVDVGGFERGQRRMRERLAATWDEWVKLPSEEFNRRMDARPFSEVIRELPIEEEEG